MDPKIKQNERSIAQAKVREMVRREVPPLRKGTPDKDGFVPPPDPIHLTFIRAIYNPDRRLG